MNIEQIKLLTYINTTGNLQHPTPKKHYKNRKYPHYCTHAYNSDATVGCKNKEIDLSFTSKISWIDHDPSLQKTERTITAE